MEMVCILITVHSQQPLDLLLNLGRLHILLLQGLSEPPLATIFHRGCDAVGVEVLLVHLVITVNSNIILE